MEEQGDDLNTPTDGDAEGVTPGVSRGESGGPDVADSLDGHGPNPDEEESEDGDDRGAPEHSRGKSAEELRAEATSEENLRLHFPHNLYCKTCVHAKITRKQNRRKKNRSGPSNHRPAPEAWGDQVATDHWFASDDLSKGCDGMTAALTIKDRSTDWRACIPVKQKSADETCQALRHFQGFS